jgi:hypothetical protein
MIKLRGLLTEPPPHGGHIHVQPSGRRALMHFVQILLERNYQPRVQTQPPDAPENSNL